MLAALLSALAVGEVTFGADEILLREGCVVLLGGAWVEGDGQRLEARAAVVFPDLRVAYAEGDILFTDEKARAAVEAEEFIYDFAQKRGAGTDVRLTKRFAREKPGEGRLEKGEVDHLVVRAKRLFLRGDIFRAVDVVATSCNFGLPHWSLTAREMHVRGREAVVGVARLKLGRATVFKLRSAALDLDQGLTYPSPRLKAGHSSKWGSYFGAGVKLKPRRLFDWYLPFLGYRSERGLWGEFSFKGPVGFESSFQDESQTSAVADNLRAQDYFDAREPKLAGDPVRRYRANVLFDMRRARDLGIAYDPDSPPQPANAYLYYEDKFRYDIEHFHTWGKGDWRGSCEVFLPSDRDYLREYDDSRLKNERDGETALYLWRSGMTYSELAVSYEPCAFRTSTDRLPSFSFAAPVVPLPGRVVLEADLSTGYLRRHWDEFWGTDDFESFRAGGSLSLSRPFRLGPVGVRPFVGTSGAYYGKGNDVQGAGVAGLEARTLLVGEFRGGRLRHIVEPRVSLLRVGPTLMDPVDVLDFDEADDLCETSVVRIELANLWQAGEEGKRTTVGALRLWTEAFLDPDEANDLNSGRAFDLISASGFYAPWKGVRLFGLAGLDPYGGGVARADYGVSLQGERSGAALAHRLVAEDPARLVLGSSELSLKLWWRPNPRWRLSCFEAYQLANSPPDVTRGPSAYGIIIERHYHDWGLRMRFKYDEGSNDTSFGVGLIVKGYTSNLERVR